VAQVVNAGFAQTGALAGAAPRRGQALEAVSWVRFWFVPPANRPML
jgi:hypothetical protein